MSLWVKICGNTSLGDARLAAEAGADAVGFVLAPSPRRVTVEQTAAIVAGLPAAIEKIGVFVDARYEQIVRAVEQAALTGVQLHSGDDAELADGLRERFGLSLRILQVVHFGEDMTETLPASAADAVLVDSRTATAVGGTGVVFDWEAARQTIFAPARELRLIAAGGLTPANVARAVAMLQPWGVDVASGVEAEPGRKDPRKVREFVGNARSISELVAPSI